MPKVTIYDMTGKSVGELDLSDAIFGIEPNKAVMHAAVVNYLANQRQGTQSALTRSEVSGGGKKPWRQKGTGRARQGSIRAPQWVGGGVALGPKPRDYRYRVNKKVRQAALRSALSSKVADEDLIVLERLSLDAIKTKEVVKILANLGVEGKALFVLPEVDKNVILSARNIPGVDTTYVGSINTYDVLNHTKCIIVKDAVSKLEEVYA